MKYIEIFKRSHTPLISENFRNDPYYEYFLKSNEENELVLPLLEYVERKTLCLQNYRITNGHTLALA